MNVNTIFAYEHILTHAHYVGGLFERYGQFCKQYFCTMSLLQLGPVMFGGVDGIIAYMRANGLLARSLDCQR